MKRKAIILRYNEEKTIAICVDEFAEESILDYIKRDAKHKQKFLQIVELILRRIPNRDLYGKEDVNEKCKNMTAMKFFKGRTNDRIYCKQFTTEDKLFVVIMAVLFEKKKVQKNNNKINNLLHKISSYEYEIVEKESE